MRNDIISILMLTHNAPPIYSPFFNYFASSWLKQRGSMSGRQRFSLDYTDNADVV